jgi:hypothetical protein
MTAPWWVAFGPAEAHVSCGGGQHRLRWADGRLDAVDHADADGELVIAALGGAATPCLDLVRVWGQHCDDLSVLAIGPRSADDQLTIGPDAIAELVSPGPDGQGLPSSARARRAAMVARARVSGTQAAAIIRSSAALSAAQPPSAPAASPGTPGARPAGAFTSTVAFNTCVMSRPSAGSVSAGRLRRPPSPSTGRGELPALMALGRPFQFRLSGAVAHAWSADGQRAAAMDDARPALTAALAGRLAPAAARWLGIDPGDVEADIHEGNGWGAVELTRSAGGPTLHAELHVSWLARVWAPGLAVVAGHLVVSVLDAAWPAARVLALSEPGTKPVELSLRHSDSGWSVAD